jgi:AcrR family transcriptional regulator
MARQQSGDTRGKVLTAAGDVFAEKGFRDATVAEICTRAGANIAAVNYHFGSKKSLYQEAWRFSFAESIKAHPPDGGVSPKAPADERLGGQIRALIKRITDRDNRDFYISQMEFTNPTGLLKEVMESALIPLREQTLSVVRDLLGPRATEQQVVFCETCIISMCFHPMLMKQVRQKMKKIPALDPLDDLGAFADHVTAFALAGIATIRCDQRSAGSSSQKAGTRKSRSGVLSK